MITVGLAGPRIGRYRASGLLGAATLATANAKAAERGGCRLTGGSRSRSLVGRNGEERSRATLWWLP